MLGLFAVGVCLAIAEGASARGEIGWDLGLYLRNTERWLENGELYRPWQLGGPYEAAGEVNLYPPLAMYLFVPFLHLPSALWWVLPTAITAVVFWLHRPPAWTWPVFAAVAATVPFGAMIAHGNSDMWVVAIVSAATIRPAFAVLLTFKPSVLPIALLFAYRRSWWGGAALVMVLAMPFGLAAWTEFIVISRNLQGQALLYSLHTVPLMAAPILAWLAGVRSPIASYGGRSSVIDLPWQLHRSIRRAAVRLPVLIPLGRLPDDPGGAGAGDRFPAPLHRQDHGHGPD